MTTYPRISIVTPNFNQGRFLEACIKSVLSQEYPNLEYIIIDGASTDASVDIIRKYRDKLAYWVSEKDNGQTDAINKGLRRATGDIFNWINADDRLTPGALARCADAWRGNPQAAGWVGGCRRIDEHGNVNQAVYPNGLDRENIGQNWNGKQFYQPSCFLSMEKIGEIGELNSSLYIAMDLDLWLRILEKGVFIAGGGVWSEAIDHDDAKTQKYKDRILRETCDLQRAYGFIEGSEKRRAAEPGAGIKYSAPDALVRRLQGLEPRAARAWRGAPPYDKRKHICYAADLESDCDIESIRYFTQEIFPEIAKKRPVEFHVIASRAREYARAHALPHVKFINRPRNINAALSRYRLFISPMARAGGLPGKIGLAAAAGLPVVTTTAGTENFPVRDGVECFIADSPREFAEKCLQILNDRVGWNNFSLRSRVMLAEKNKSG